MCDRQCLNPFDPEQQKGVHKNADIDFYHQIFTSTAHRRECLERHEREMERAFQVQG
jgi:hypothetical protein